VIGASALLLALGVLLIVLSLTRARCRRAMRPPRRGRPPRTATGLDAETTKRQAQEMRRLRQQGYTWDAIARRYGVSPKTARRRVAWLDEDDVRAPPP
jgi:hypothetical protein